MSCTTLKSRERSGDLNVQQNNESQGSRCPSHVLHTSSTRPLCLLFCHISITKQHLVSFKCLSFLKKSNKTIARSSVKPSINWIPLLHLRSPPSSCVWWSISVFPLAAILQRCWPPPPSACSESSWRIPLGWCRSPLSAAVSCAQRKTD